MGRLKLEFVLALLLCLCPREVWAWAFIRDDGIVRIIQPLEIRPSNEAQPRLIFSRGSTEAFQLLVDEENSLIVYDLINARRRAVFHTYGEAILELSDRTYINSLSVTGHTQIGSFPSLGGPSRFGAQTPVSDFVTTGPPVSSHGVAHPGSVISAYGMSRLGMPLPALDYIHPDMAPIPRSSPHLGLALVVYGLVRPGAAPPAPDPAAPGSPPPARAPAKPGSAPAAHSCVLGTALLALDLQHTDSFSASKSLAHVGPLMVLVLVADSDAQIRELIGASVHPCQNCCAEE